MHASKTPFPLLPALSLACLGWMFFLERAALGGSAFSQPRAQPEGEGVSAVQSRSPQNGSAALGGGTGTEGEEALFLT